MSKDKLALRIEGDVSLGDFAKTLSNLFALLQEIEREITGKNEIEWRVVDLDVGDDNEETGESIP